MDAAAGNLGAWLAELAMKTLRFWVSAIPVAQPRHRDFRLPTGRRIQVSAPKSHPVHHFRACTVHEFAHCNGDAPPIRGPVALRIVFFFPRLKAARSHARAWKTTRPDLDNLEKAVMDALSGVAYVDDRQVAVKQTAKILASGLDAPGALVEVAELALHVAIPWLSATEDAPRHGSARHPSRAL